MVPIFLADCSIVTFEGRTNARGIGSVIETMLKMKAEVCQQDQTGFSTSLNTALDHLRGTPYNLKFIINTLPNNSKNALELVHARPTLDIYSLRHVSTPRFVETVARGVVESFPQIVFKS